MWLKSVAIGRGWVGRMSERILVVMVVMCEGMCVHSCHMLVERCAVGVERIGGRLGGTTVLAPALRTGWCTRVHGESWCAESLWLIAGDV